MEIYFVRHGKTEWNLERRFQGGHGDSHLLPESYADIEKLGKYLRKTKFRAVYASPLERARTTALKLEEAMNCSLPVHIDERLREMNLGKMEGEKFDKIAELYSEQIDDFWHHPEKFDAASIDAESYPHAMERGLSFGREMSMKYPGKEDKILVVSHGAVLSAIMGALLGYDVKHVRQNGVIYNTSVTILASRPDGQYFDLVKWSDVTPLGKQMSETDGL